MSEAVTVAPIRVKPRLRGVSHEIAFYAAIAATLILVKLANPGLPRLASGVYGASLVLLFGTSALYHRPMWTPTARARMRRADHAAIFVLIGGSYAPLGLLALPTDVSHRLLGLVWGGCAIGIVKSLFWAHAPRWITVAIYVIVSWSAALELPALGHALGPVRTALIVGGGICYSVGALVYARRRPDPLPAVFGYHEIFHVLVIVAAALQFGAIANVILATPGG
jgi:hemolysin III